MEYLPNRLMGMWKFSDVRVARAEIEELAEEFAKDDRYELVFVRAASKDQTGVGFLYKYDGTPEGKKAYHDEVTDMLYKKFGNGLKGWDYATSPAVVKNAYTA